MMASVLLLTATDACSSEFGPCTRDQFEEQGDCCPGHICGCVYDFEKGACTDVYRCYDEYSEESSAHGPGALLNEEIFGQHKEAQPDMVGIPTIMAGVIAVLLGCIAMLLCFAICGRPMMAIYAADKNREHSSFEM